MNGYDFDKTIYSGDSLADFYLWTILKRPFLVALTPYHLFMLMLYALKLISKKQIKEIFMFNLRFFKDKSALVNDFWNKHIKKIKAWYLNQKNFEDIIISASPEFLVRPACERLGLKNIIGSDMDINTGKISGDNCYGKNKVKRFKKQFGDIKLESFYSDSKSDLPMMHESKKGILVKGNERKIIFEA